MMVVLTGLMAGAVHVLTGPDHLAAIAPLAARGQNRGWVRGIRWGIGHFAGLAIVALLSLWLREKLPLELISSWGERVVGAVLIVIGLWALRHAICTKLHVHEHDHDGGRHLHVHVHVGHGDHELPGAHEHTHASVAIGALHGLAGSSHVLAILPMLALPTAAQAVTYLLAFGIGTVAAMGAFSCGMGKLSERCAAHHANLYRGMMSGCAVAAILLGGVWMYGGSW
ncbi:MAG: sulfite exporter TauE/SafE family protein [Candidatus Sumerlaeaceae bacterium]